MSTHKLQLKSALEQAGPDSPVYAAVPAQYRSLVWGIVEATSAVINNGGQVSPCVIIGSTSGREARRVDISLASHESKHRSYELARQVASEIKANFAITSIESWSLTPQDRPRRDEICAKYGSLREYPGRVEAAWFVLETLEGTFSSQAVIERMDAQGHQVRTMLDPENFALSHEMQGELIGLLAPPIKSGMKVRMH